MNLFDFFRSNVMPAGVMTDGIRALFTLLMVTPHFRISMAVSSEFQLSQINTVLGAEAENLKCWCFVMRGIRLK